MQWTIVVSVRRVRFKRQLYRYTGIRALGGNM